MPAQKRSKIKSISIGNLEWVHVSSTDKEEIDALRRGFRLHPIDLQETLPPLQRPKLVARDEYLFMILLYPVYDVGSGTVRASEVDFFIIGNTLITVNNDHFEPLEKLFRHLEKSVRAKKRNNTCPVDGMSHLLYLVLNDFLEQVSPLLVQLSRDMDAMEARIFQDYEKGLIQKLLRVKTNIVNVRKAMQGHKHVIRLLIKHASSRFPIQQLEIYFERLVEQTKEFWDMLEVQRDTINALHEANASLIDFRVNEIMKTLTVFAVIVFPLTLLAAIFGMNVRMPIVDHPQGFWIILGMMIAGALGMLWFFKKKGWI